jgi:hypothetical protein
MGQLLTDIETALYEIFVPKHVFLSSQPERWLILMLPDSFGLLVHYNLYFANGFKRLESLLESVIVGSNKEVCFELQWRLEIFSAASEPDHLLRHLLFQ